MLVALFVYGAATNDAFHWDIYGKYIFDQRLSSGAWVTIQLTFWAMVLGVVLGSLLAVMRLTDNVVLRSIAWVYVWIFRGTPVYVQLSFWGLFTTLYQHLRVGIPFGPTLATFDIANVEAAFFFAALGLGLNEAGYMAEIVRAGITSVGEGQSEAATALGMSWWHTMRRVVLPQAMRVIIPPTGNEVISMLKTASLVVAIPLTAELYYQARQISAAIYQPIPLLLAAATWYLVITSIFTIGQYFLEKRFARGSSRTMTDRQLRAMTAGPRSGGAA